MIEWAASTIMRRRARRVFQRVSRHLPDSGVIADVGSGTGHNGQLIRAQTSLSVQEFDVADLHWVGPGPRTIIDGRIPRDDDQFHAALLLYVLHYSDDAQSLLAETSRVTSGPIIVLQSTHQGASGQAALRCREYFFGRGGFHAAKAARLLATDACSLHPRQYYSRDELVVLFDAAGLSVISMAPQPSTILRKVSRDLFVLKRKSS